MTTLSRARVGGAALLVLVFGVLGLVPILAGPGYETALVAGLLGPATAAVVTSRELSARRLGAFATLARAVESGLLLSSVIYLTALVHGLRAGLCDLAGDSWLFFLGPGIGTVLGSVWGAVATELARRLVSRRGVKRSLLGVVFALSLPLAGVVSGVAFFYFTPAVFAYDPFVGYFSGALYDTVLSLDGLLRYRGGSLATLIACYVAALHLERAGRGWRYRSLGRPGLMALGVVALGLSAASVIFGSELGFWQTRATIEHALGGETTVGRCRVVFDRSLDRHHVERFARDCDAHIERLSRRLGTQRRHTITTFLFAGVDQKRALMGAARTSIAKPWRDEIYLHDAPYPHGVVDHELAHALLAEFGRGPFAVAGDFGGLLPNPGLIEGLAVAVAPDDDDLGTHEWAAAMRRIAVLPSVDDLFQLTFFARSSAASYTAAGAFIDFVAERHGMEVVTRWYQGGDIAVLTGESRAALEEAWWHSLDALPLSDAALATARARFDRPGVLSRRCPHVVDARLAEANGETQAGDHQAALALYRRVLALDPGNSGALLGVARCYQRLGDTPGAERTLALVASHLMLPEATRGVALEEQGDLALRRGDAAGARSFYAAIRGTITEEGRLRTLEVKEHYAAEAVAREAVAALLVGLSERGPDTAEALDRIGLWRATAPGDGTPDYLFARQHIDAKNYALAITRLEEALERGVPLERVRLEALRLLVVASCAAGDGERARRSLELYRAHPLVSENRAMRAAELVERCTGR
jgi:hypothetical protein